MKTKQYIACLVTLIVLATAGKLYVDAVSVGGGTWNYGVGLTGSYSDYYHPAYYHTATVWYTHDNYHKDDGVPGEWAKANLWRYSGCHFYWDVP